MMRKDFSNEAVVEALLSQYQIKELEDQRQKNALVATLLNGEKRLIEFEKTIIPAQSIGKYIVAEHKLPIPFMPMTRHNVNSIVGFNNIIEARSAYHTEVSKSTQRDYAINQPVEIMLLGEYHGQLLSFDSKGLPDVNAALVIGSTFTKGGDIPGKTCVVKELLDLSKPLTVTNKFYVEFNSLTGLLKFQRDFLRGGDLDVGFWKTDTENERLMKGRKNAEDLPKMDTELWVNESLLIKKNGGKSHGRGIS